MLKKYFLLAVFIWMGSRLEAFDLPTYFNLDRSSIYVTGYSIMHCRTEDKSLALIKRHISGSIWSKRIPRYELLSPTDGFEAVAKVDSTDQEYRVIFTVLDKDNQSLGRIEENWENNYFSSTPTIEIYSADQQLLARGTWNFNASSLTLVDPSDEHKIVFLTAKGIFIIGDYSVLLEDPQFLNRIDSRLLILSLAVVSDKGFHYKLCGYNPVLSENIKAFQEELKGYEDQFAGIEPSEEDINFALSFEESVFVEIQKEIEPSEEPIEKAYQAMLPLLEQETLTSQQKSALFLLLKHNLEQIN